MSTFGKPGSGSPEAFLQTLEILDHAEHEATFRNP